MHQLRTFRAVFVPLLAARCIGALFNIIYDCDEVYNYWEPLHRLLYGYGKQPWEYSPQYALRSYFYLLLHATVAFPLKWIFGNDLNKIWVFYGTRLVFALISAVLETQLQRSVARIFPAAASAFFWVLWCNAGLVMASATFLPSSFAMHCMTAATVALMNGNRSGVIFWSVVGVVLGWPVAGIAFVPYAIYILIQPRLLQSFAMLFLSLAAVLVPFVASDIYFYGRATVSLWNFIQYNVIGGGQSALYGVEDVSYYLRNGFLNFNFMLLLSVLYPILALLVDFRSGAMKDRQEKLQDVNEGALPTRVNLRTLMIACAPAYLWVCALSCLPHKEERFLYVVYPQICLSGALSLVLLIELAQRIQPKWLRQSFKQVPWSAVMGVYVCLSVMRAAAMWANFSAPMIIYHSLPAVESPDRVYVCTGDEWHRFPSSFHLPSSSYRLGFLEQEFNGLLPADFSEASLGTRAIQTHFNDQNRVDPANYVDISTCSFVVDFESVGDGASLSRRYDPDNKWTLLAAYDILDRPHSPLLSRMFYLPMLNKSRNRFGKYVLYRTY